jgi:hypothetical protein
MRTEDARARKIVCDRRVGITRSEPEIICNSGLGDPVSTEQVHIIILLLSGLALLARRRNDWRQLAGTTLDV